jgi:hypothetical protein
MPVEKAKNYNPFYETPFDGLVGYNGTTYARANYGVSFNGSEIKLNNASSPLSTKSYTGNPLQKINSTTYETLEALNSGIVLRYDLSANALNFYPSKPNPVAITIVNNSTNPISASYTLEPITQTLQSEWRMVSSTVSVDGDNCLDFSKNDVRSFTESVSGGTRTINWSGTTKKGTIILAKNFFTPKTTTETIKLTSTDTNKVTLNGITNRSSSVWITNTSAADPVNYNDLEFIFNQIRNENMCMSKPNNYVVNVWWNQEYLDDLIDSVVTNRRGSC